MDGLPKMGEGGGEHHKRLFLVHKRKAVLLVNSRGGCFPREVSYSKASIGLIGLSHCILPFDWSTITIQPVLTVEATASKTTKKKYADNHTHSYKKQLSVQKK